MQMTLGRFVFGFKGTGTAFQSLKRKTSQRWVKADRVGRRASNQHLGPGDDVVTIPGVIMPEICGPISTKSMQIIRDIADEGKPVNLIMLNDSRGDIAGKWIVLDVDETKTNLVGNLPQKIEFTITVRRDDGSTARGLYR